jgi:hypothetical protein
VKLVAAVAAVPHLLENKEEMAEQVPELKSLLLNLTETMQHRALQEFLLEAAVELEHIAQALGAEEDVVCIHPQRIQLKQILAAEPAAA